MPPQPNPNFNGRMRSALYALKREYGNLTYLYKVTSIVTDPVTGLSDLSWVRHEIRRAVVLPKGIKREVVRGISLISANKQIVEGGGYDAAQRDFIIDRRDLRGVSEINKDDFLVYRGHKYEIKDAESLEWDSGWIINARELIGEVFVPEQSNTASDALTFTQETEAEVDGP